MKLSDIKTSHWNEYLEYVKDYNEQQLEKLKKYRKEEAELRKMKAKQKKAIDEYNQLPFYVKAFKQPPSSLYYSPLLHPMQFPSLPPYRLKKPSIEDFLTFMSKF